MKNYVECTKEENLENTFVDKIFGKDDIEGGKWARGEYDHCMFRHINLHGADFSTCIFIDCIFEDCDLSVVKLNNTVFRDVEFSGCKLMGIHFENCNKFGLAFLVENCVLNHSSFYRTSLKKTIFRHAQLIETDFTECDLTACVFNDCNFAGAKFENTILEKADLRTAINFSINPETNRIRKARFSASALAGLLDKYDIDIEG